MGPLFRPQVPHAPGARMTVVKQTPSNYVHMQTHVCIFRKAPANAGGVGASDLGIQLGKVLEVVGR